MMLVLHKVLTDLMDKTKTLRQITHNFIARSIKAHLTCTRIYYLFADFSFTVAAFIIVFTLSFVVLCLLSNTALLAPVKSTGKLWGWWRAHYKEVREHCKLNISLTPTDCRVFGIRVLLIVLLRRKNNPSSLRVQLIKYSNGENRPSGLVLIILLNIITTWSDVEWIFGLIR